MAITAYPHILAEAAISILYASLWIHYLYQLAAAPTPPDRSLRKCREVEPVVRSVLLVFGWLSAVLGACVLCVLLSFLCMAPSLVLLMMVLLYAIIVLIYVYQIQYLRAVEVSDQLIDDGCDLVEPKKRRMLMLFAVMVLLFGVTGTVVGVVSGGHMDGWVDGHIRNWMKTGVRI